MTDGVADDCLGSHDKLASSSSKVATNKRALLELKVETETDTEKGTVLAGMTAIASEFLAEGPSCDPPTPGKPQQAQSSRLWNLWMLHQNWPRLLPRI